MNVITLWERAFQNDCEGLIMLAYSYEKGHGVDENRDISYKLYERAAMTGNAEAQWRYAYVTAYWKGEKEKARLWYEKSVKQGNEEAKRLLETLDSDV